MITIDTPDSQKGQILWRREEWLTNDILGRGRLRGYNDPQIHSFVFFEYLNVNVHIDESEIVKQSNHNMPRK